MNGAGRLPKPLEGIRVLDFSRLLPGAYCTWMLATLGAEVTKVEQPGSGDYQRRFGVQVGDRGGAVFQLVNQGKRSIAIDIKHPQSGPILKALIDRADIIVEGFRPGVAARIGIDFAALLKARPSLVCVSISGFGANSPLRSTAAHDINYMALSGLLGRHLQGEEGMPELPLADLVGGGLMPALSILSLLLRAKLTGIGGIADGSLGDGVALLPYDIMAAVIAGTPEPRREEAEFGGSRPDYATYRLRDGHVAVGAVEDKFWEEVCTRMDLPPGSRSREDGEAVKAILTEKFAAMSRADVDALFAEADACVTVVRSYGEAFASEHAGARQYLAPPPEPGAMPRLGSPFFHDGSRAFAEGVAPHLGEQTAEILGELGHTAGEIEAVTASGAVEATGGKT